MKIGFSEPREAKQGEIYTLNPAFKRNHEFSKSKSFSGVLYSDSDEKTAGYWFCIKVRPKSPNEYSSSSSSL